MTITFTVHMTMTRRRGGEVAARKIYASSEREAQDHALYLANIYGALSYRVAGASAQ